MKLATIVLLILTLFTITGYQHYRIATLHQAHIAQQALNQELVLIVKMLNTQGTHLENRYYTLRSLMKGEK